jgi:hypothetical protein
MAFRRPFDCPIVKPGAPGGDADLFLVCDDAVGVREDRLELLQFVFDLGLALLARDEVVDHARLQRPRPIERVERDQIVQALGLRLAQQLTHPRALELEDAIRLAVGEELVCFLVVQRNRVDVQRDAFGPLDLGQAVLDERQRAQAQEVHLEEADPLDFLHRPLRDDFVLLRLVERDELGQRPWRDDDAGRVHGGVARHALEPLRDRQQLFDAFVLLLHLLERRALGQRLLQRHVERRGDGFRDLVGVGVRDVHHARDVAHDRARLHRPERDDLGDVLAPVLFGDVADHLAAAAFAEIDVDIRQRHALDSGTVRRSGPRSDRRR